MPGRTLLSLALIAWLFGCGRPQETVAPPPAKAWKQAPVADTPPSQEDEPANEAHHPHQSGNEEHKPEESEKEPAESIDSSQTESNDPSGDRTYNTGDCDDWPSYELPLVVEIEMLEFPEGVTRRAEPIPDEDG
jgi:hypothetical protein